MKLCSTQNTLTAIAISFQKRLNLPTKRSMTVSATTTAGRSTGSNSLHGTLRFLSKKYSSKRSKWQNSSNIVVERRARAHAGFPTLRKSSTPRSDRLQFFSTVNSNRNGVGDSNISSEDQRNGPTKDAEGKTQFSPEPQVKVGQSATETSDDNGVSDGASENVDHTGSQMNQSKERETESTTKTKMTTKLLHPEDLAQYHEAEEVETNALKKIEMAQRKVFNDQVQHVWGVYIYGLKHVLALNDLSDAPDAILPGNF